MAKKWRIATLVLLGTLAVVFTTVILVATLSPPKEYPWWREHDNITLILEDEIFNTECRYDYNKTNIWWTCEMDNTDVARLPKIRVLYYSEKPAMSIEKVVYYKVDKMECAPYDYELADYNLDKKYKVDNISSIHGLYLTNFNFYLSYEDMENNRNIILKKEINIIVE